MCLPFFNKVGSFRKYVVQYVITMRDEDSVNDHEDEYVDNVVDVGVVDVVDDDDDWVEQTSLWQGCLVHFWRPGQTAKNLNLNL